MYLSRIFFSVFLFSVELFSYDSNIIERAFEYNQYSHFKNISFEKYNDNLPVVLQKNSDGREIQLSFERHLYNNFDSMIKNRDLFFIKSGALKGVGGMITTFYDRAETPKYLLWLPAIRKVRSIGNPLDHNGFGVLDKSMLFELKLRSYDDENHKFVSEQYLDLEIEAGSFLNSKYSKNLPSESVKVSDKFIEIESTPKYENWYSKRVSLIESDTNLERKTLYFDEQNKLILSVYRDFIKIDNQFVMNYRYSIDNINRVERLIYIPAKSIKINRDISKSFWSDSTLANL